jgi:hypothetical protein
MNKIKINTARLRREVKAEINSARIISEEKSPMSSFDRKTLTMLKAEVSDIDRVALSKLISNRSGYRVLSTRD